MLKCIIVLSLMGLTFGKIYFPGNEFREPNVNLRNANGSEAWFSHVDTIISSGIFTLSKTFQNELAKQTGRNIVFSPTCIAELLALLLLGSNGISKQEVAQILGFATGIDFKEHSYLVHDEFGRLLKSVQNDNTTSVASALFSQNYLGISDQYVKAAKDIYNSEVVSNLDFKRNPQYAQTVINNWVRSKTHGKINTILDSTPSSDNRMVIVSTLYFNAEWVEPFGSPQSVPFFPNGYGNPPEGSVELMSIRTNFPYYQDPILNCQVVGFPYKGGSTIFYAILPNDSSRTVLKEFQNQLTSEHLQRLTSNLKSTDLLILFPKLKMTKSMSFKDILKTMGMSSIFDPRTADLSAMFQYDNLGERIRNGENLYVDDILHKVHIEVTETGTIGAAAAAAVIAKSSVRTLKFNTPFSFLIRNEKSKLDLFYGSVHEPESS